MTDLDELLQAASKSSPGTRIQYRDPIAAHGSGAIGPMVDWIPSPKLGAFAVRVLTKIGQDAAHKGQVVAALRDCDRRGLDPNVARDVDDAIRTLRPFHGAKRGGSVPAAGPGQAEQRGRLPGDSVEERFHNAMLDIYWLAGRATGYWASYFLRGVRNKGGLVEAKDLLRMAGNSEGFERLKAEHRLDLSMEALVLQPEFVGLFTQEEVQAASSRLAAAGYQSSEA